MGSPFEFLKFISELEKLTKKIKDDQLEKCIKPKKYLNIFKKMKN